MFTAASRLEACDDLLLRIFRSIPLADKLRLTVTSKRWQRLLLSELSGIKGAVPSCRVADVVRWAGKNLVSLDLTAQHEGEGGPNAEAAVAAACEACPNLRKLVMCSPDGPNLGTISASLASYLATTCLLLDDSSRVAINISSFVSGTARILDALPGRHFLRRVNHNPWLVPNFSIDAELAALHALLAHRRLAGLSISGARDDSAAWDRIVDAVFAALISTARSGDDTSAPRYCLERLHLSNWGGHAPSQRALLTESGVRAAREKAQETLGGAARLLGNLRSIELEGSCQRRNVDAELLAHCAPATLRRLRLTDTSAPADAAALAALLQPFAGSLVHLDLGGGPSASTASVCRRRGYGAGAFHVCRAACLSPAIAESLARRLLVREWLGG